MGGVNGCDWVGCRSALDSAEKVGGYINSRIGTVSVTVGVVWVRVMVIVIHSHITYPFHYYENL